MRGFLAAILSVAALYFIALPEKDLVAAVIGGGVLAILAAVLALSLILRFRLGRRLAIEARFDPNDPRSQRDIDAGLIFKNSGVPPYFTLSAQRVFSEPGVKSVRHLLKGREPQLGKRHITDRIMFPHRGLWLLEAIDLQISDALGFTSLKWSHALGGSVEVSAPMVSIKPLPVVAASSRAGDELDQARERSGDLFDLKQYDPSDGIKRILWKTYAKSGELVVRRPEPAIIPEGEVAVFLVADREDDVVAGALQHYLQKLEQQQITVLFGTDGLHYQPTPGIDQVKQDKVSKGAAGGAQYYTVNPEDIQRAINHSVWSRASGTAADFEAYLESLAGDNRAVHNVIVFAPARATGTSPAHESLWFSRMLRSAALHSVKLSVALVGPELSVGYYGEFARNRRQSPLFPETTDSVLGGAVGAKLIRVLPAALRPAESPKLSTELTGRIAASGSDLFMVEGYE